MSRAGQSRSPSALLRHIGATVHGITRPGPNGLAEIGALGAVPCWTAALAPAGAASLCRTLTRRGLPGLLIADEPRGSRRTLAVSVPPVPVAVIARDDFAALAVVRLSRLRSDGSVLGTALAAAQAIDVDATGRKAFRALRGGVDEMVDALPRTIPVEERHGWALLQVTRLLFLRFVESEGWLDGRADFLATEFDACLARGGAPERRFLAPLFHGTLNREPAARSRLARAFGAIPFLNGGLFEAHPLERRRQWSLPTPSWCRLFALLVESFEVTLDRGDAGDRVSPELMGRVFEGVMHPDERRDSGTYFTPGALAPAVLRDALTVHLAQRLARSDTEIARALPDPDPVLRAAMRSTRVLDPACGSGTFLVEALHLLSGPDPDAAVVRKLVTTRLFGVDRHPAAVRIAELRLWLELLRAMRGRPIARLTPLPNLDTTIRVGDAVLDPFAGSRLPPVLLRRIRRLDRAIGTLHGAERRRALAVLHRLERVAARRATADRITVLRAALADIREGARAPDLFGASHRPSSLVRQRATGIRAELHVLVRQRRQLAVNDTAAAFGIESAFAPVLAAGGFDLVVGNPPWVRGERLPATTRARLASRYRWWRAGGTGWRHAPDLAVAFLERGIELLAPGGTIAFLLPAKLATAGYATRCRAGVIQRCRIDTLADLTEDPRAAFAATTYPLAVIATRQPAPPDHQVRLGLGADAPRFPAVDLAERSTWPLGSPALESLIRRMASVPNLADALHPALGVKTGANDAFLDPAPSLHGWTRPAIRGRDVSPLLARPSVRLLWPADARGRPLERLPAPVECHLRAQRDRLERRRDYVGGPWWQLYRTAAATGRWRVIWSDLARRLSAAPLRDPDPVPLNTCYVVTLRDEGAMLALAAWLSSSPIGALARVVAEPAANGYARFGARAVGAVPLPAGVLDDPRLREYGAGAWSGSLAAALDAHVASLLDLGDSERDAINAIDPHRG